MKHSIIITAVFAGLLSVGCSRQHRVTVVNSLGVDRNEEIIEIDAAAVDSLMNHSQFRIIDDKDREVPYQVTYDGRLIFPATVAANSSTVYTLVEGEPSAVDTIATGAFYPRRKDDFTWENDRSAYRAYGPALQQSGERAFGYDIWTKSVARPVVAQRYTDAFAEVKNFHNDYGEGMDVYTVGPTLGGGTAALIDSLGNIVYPWCFSSYDILDNGPLRFTVMLSYDSGETRRITLDAGEFLNRTEVCFGKVNYPTIAPGIVIHRQNPDGYVLSPEEGYMAYADLTDNAENGNGVIYVGVVTPEVDSMLNIPFDTPQGDALGHILAKKSYTPGECYVYYWGSGWSKGDMPDWQTWKKYLSDFHTRLQNPLSVTIK
ncbi:MAG: DUF4861 domain-containing protein [Bacteroidales bacterium]|nr:DUF4861 domain-containing protein [Bacteroidales bacterium]